MKVILRLIYQYLNFVDFTLSWIKFKAFSFGQKKLTQTNTQTLLNPRASEVCHIIAAGQTATYELGKIDNNDLVFGSSISPLAYEHLTHYFCEVYSQDNKFRSVVYDMYFELLPKLRSNGVVILHKNFWHSFNKKNIYRELAKEEDINVFEYFLRFYTTKRRDFLLKKVLKEKHLFQCSASNILFLQLASHSGCKKVVFHGVDGGGKYFLEDEYFKNNSLLSNITMEDVAGFYRSSGTHLTRKSVVHDQFEVLKIISNQLGIEVYSSSIRSPLSSIFPVYEAK